MIELLKDRRVRYVMAGGTAAVVYYAVFSGGWLLSHGRVPYLAMAAIANLITAVSTYPLYRRGVFRARGPWLAGLLRFYLICLWSFIFTMVGLPALVELAGMPVLLAQAILIVVAPLINYQINKHWAFRERAHPP